MAEQTANVKAKNFECGGYPQACGIEAEEYINNEIPKIMDGAECTSTALIWNDATTGLLVICHRTLKAIESGSSRAKNFECGGYPQACGRKAEEYINNEIPKIMDGAECTSTALIWNGATTGLLVTCRGKLKETESGKK